MTLPPADTIHESRWRLEEMKVEMAWLADPATFHHLIVARVVDGSLELRGSVSTVAERDTAFHVAQLHSHLPVVNTLAIDTGLQPRESALDEAVVRQGAVEVLNDAFGMAARGFEIRADDKGQVAVSGSVSSVEEKLAVSRKLRKVRGCTSAANYLQISPVMRDGRMVTQINAAGTLVVPGQVLCLDGTGQEPATSRASAVPGPMPPAVSQSPPAVKTAPAASVTVNSQQLRPAVRPSVVQVQSTTPAQPVAPPIPPAVMPIEVPIPPVTTPAASALPRGASALPSSRILPDNTTTNLPTAPCPSFVQNWNDSKPATASSANTPVRAPVPLPRDPAAANKIQTSHNDKEVDLLAVPTVPQSWSKDGTPATATAKPKPKPASTFATVRPEPTRVLSNDELLSLPAVPLTGAEKQPAKPVAPTPVVAKPATVPNKPSTIVPMSPAPQATPKTWTAEVVISQPKPATSGPSAAPAAPADLKPLVAPPQTQLKDTWVDAVPAPSPQSTPGHPLPPNGGWAAAHVSGPAPTSYVTSGVLVFPDDHTSATKPAPVASVSPAPVISHVAARVETPPPVVYSPTPKPVTSAANQPALPSPVKLKQQVEHACGRMIKSADVVWSGNEMTVHVICATGFSPQLITDRILVHIPDMSNTKVKLEVEGGQ
jgi:osmotically-inducible protein OsmY